MIHLDEILNYIYFGEMSPKSYTIDFFIALAVKADYYMLDGLVDYCMAQVSNKLNDNNVIEVYMVADMHFMSQLMELCIDYITFR